MGQDQSFGSGTHIALQNKEQLAHPTRFERVTFAFGGQVFYSMARRGAPGTASRSTWFTLWVGLKGTYTSELHLKSSPIPATH
jgi:hypothetical protein